MNDQWHQDARNPNGEAKNFYMRYVPHELAQAYTALGWIDCAPDGGRSHHAVHSRLMRWEGENPPAPKSVSDVIAKVLEDEDA